MSMGDVPALMTRESTDGGNDCFPALPLRSSAPLVSASISRRVQAGLGGGMGVKV